jgi:Peptidase family S41
MECRLALVLVREIGLVAGIGLLGGSAAGNRSARALSAGGANLDPAEMRRVVDTVARDVREHYVDRRAARNMANALAAHQRLGDDTAATDGPSLALLLTHQLRDIRQDLELEVIFSADPIPLPPHPDPDQQRRYRRMIIQEHCLLEKVQVLRAWIGYMKLNGFADRAICESMVRAAMAELNDARAMIFDLRDNRGGMPETVELFAEFLFDHPEYWFNPREPATERSWTRSPVPGNRLADKPVYVLTSARTISGGEQFCYDLKALKRATLVGETTAGASHAGAFYRIDGHFAVAIPEVRPLNPYGTADWQGVGVAPDVAVKAEDALDKAMELARKGLEQKW